MGDKQDKYSVNILLVLLLIFVAGVIASIAHAGSMEPEAVEKTYKKTEKTCKQMERDHTNMKGQHELMFKSWQEKSVPILSEDKKLIGMCQDSVLKLKLVLDKFEKAGHDELLLEDDKQQNVIEDYKKLQSMIEMINTLHKKLKEDHGRIFHDMMGH